MMNKENVEVEEYSPTYNCVTCGEPVEVPAELRGKGPFKHGDCPEPSGV